MLDLEHRETEGQGEYIYQVFQNITDFTSLEHHCNTAKCLTAQYKFFYLGVIVDLNTSVCVDVLRADNLTMPLQRLQLEKLCC